MLAYPVCRVSRRGNCYDNAVMESSLSTVKGGLVMNELVRTATRRAGVRRGGASQADAPRAAPRNYGGNATDEASRRGAEAPICAAEAPRDKVCTAVESHRHRMTRVGVTARPGTNTAAIREVTSIARAYFQPWPSPDFHRRRASSPRPVPSRTIDAGSGVAVMPVAVKKY